MQLFLSFSIILVLIKNKLFCILFVLCFPSTLRALRTCPLLSRNMMRSVNEIVQQKFYNCSHIPGMRKLKYIFSLFLFEQIWMHALIYVYIIIDLAQILSCSKWISYSKTPFFLVDFKLTYQYCWVAVDEKH